MGKNQRFKHFEHFEHLSKSDAFKVSKLSICRLGNNFPAVSDNSKAIEGNWGAISAIYWVLNCCAGCNVRLMRLCRINRAL